jgi:SAM-dependent methyltransferase
MTTTEEHPTAGSNAGTASRGPAQALLDLAMGATVSRTLHLIADRGVADAIRVGDSTDPTSLAARVGCDEDALHRMLQLLAVHGIFRLVDGRWEHTDSSRLLRRDDPQSMAAFVTMMGLPLNWDCLTSMHHSLTTGRPAAELLDPDGFFGYLRNHPDQSAVFNDAMTSKAHADIAAIVADGVLGDSPLIADIGGGHGHLLNAVLDANPHTSGILFDLPHVISEVAPRPDGRLELHPGDFFTDPLPSFDTAVMMQVLHDWNDDAATAIIRAVRTATDNGGKLVLFENVLGDGVADPARVIDIIMLSVTGGQERTTTQFRQLLAISGFHLDGITPLPTGLSVITATAK